MKKIVNRLKNYKPAKQVALLYFFIPLMVISIRNDQADNDIWFLLNHGKYVLQYGIPHIEPFTIHQGFSFVMQQWLSAVIFYLSYSFLGKYGLWLVMEIVTCLIMYFLYKLCMKICNDRIGLSILMTILTTILLAMQIVTRPQIFTFLFLIIIMYIMEEFYDNPNTKKIYFLPFISLLQINFHASMWFMIYIFMLPYIASLLYDKFKYRKNNKLIKLLIIIIIMFIMGFINPYGIDAIKYGLNSYGNYETNKIVAEMSPVMLGNIDSTYFRNLFIISIIASTLLVYIFYKNGKLQLRHFFLLYGTIFLALSNARNYGLFIIGSTPFLSSYIQNSFSIYVKTEKVYNKKLLFLTKCMFLLISFLYFSVNNNFMTSNLKNGIDAILRNNKSDGVILYINYDYGGYSEYRGIKSYIDPRAEVFFKINNHKEDIMKEFYSIVVGDYDYDNFIDKYNFTHMLIDKDERIYPKAIKDSRYKIIYKNKEYAVFEKKVK